ITGLGNGGAEGVLYRLCETDLHNRHIIISLSGLGKYGALIKESNKEVYCLNMRSGRFSIRALFKLFVLFKKLNPDIIQTWMYHADFFGGFVARLAGFKNVFWNIRHTTLLPENSKKSTILVAKICARLSGIIPKGIICCAEEAMRVHFDLGYKKRKMTVIANGYDTLLFKPSEELRFSFRNEFELNSKTIILGMVGRFHPQKNHLGLLEALSLVKKSFEDFKFLLIGRDLNYDNFILDNEIKKQNLESNILLLNQRSDMPAVMNALDINVLSSSSGEGFPNVLAEAMACGTPCVTTNIGDAALIVDNTGWVLQPNDPTELANAIIEAIEERSRDEQSWVLRKQNCRTRIVQNFSLDKMIKNYHLVWGI
ncbi:glycosyltransferase, partial [Flavobacteriaceae bacterium]|nr:glycosyltransferase [Flavobacteriaceae bacterium]